MSASPAPEFDRRRFNPGRPKNNDPRKGSFKRWRPLQWRPEYDRVVAYSVIGKSNIWIAKQLDFTPQHVSNLLRQPQAIAFAEKLHEKMRAQITINVPEVLSQIAEKSVLRLKEIIYDDELFQKSPFAVVDRGLEVIKGLGHIRGGGNGALQPTVNTVNIGTAILAPHERISILEGLERIKEVKQLHGTDNDS